MSVLVLSWDRVGERMAGSAIRTVELARALANGGLEVVLGAPEGSVLSADQSDVLQLASFAPEAPLAPLIARADVVVVSGRVELMSAVKKPLVVDLYDPFVLSNLDLYGERFNRSGGRSLLALRWLEHHLANGDFFLCASATQRSFWLGMLAAAGRINHANYADDPELRRLLAIVPFGVPDQDPEPGAPAVKGVLPGIEAGDRVVTWAGGMWNWVDPLTLIHATALLRERRPEVKTLILGTRHPNPEIGEMAIAREARALASELGLLDRGVSFLDWVPYAERHRYLLESDVGVSLHRSGVESEFAFRTRVLDYLWCGVPMVVTAGDELAARVEREDLGRVVRPDDPAAVAAAIADLLDTPDAAARAGRLAAARDELRWSRVVEPLRAFCTSPRHAPDRTGDAWFAPGSTRDEVPRKEQALVADEMVSDARTISPALGPEFAPRQRFRAAYDGLCQVEVLFWVEPPVGDVNLLFELFYAGDEPELAARVLVPAAHLPRSDWQRFEFQPLAASRGRLLEFRLSLTSANTGEATGRVCVWRCAPPPGEALEGDAIAFLARYLVGGVLEHVPSPPEDFLFMHNTTVPLASRGAGKLALDEGLSLATTESAIDVDQLRSELARVSAQAAAAEQRANALAAGIDARVNARIGETARNEARREVATQVQPGAMLLRLVESVFASLLVGVRALQRVAVRLLVVALMVATVPLALVLAAGLAGCDLLARLRRPQRSIEPPLVKHRARPTDAVSVVIPTWNGRSLLEMSIPPLIEALRRHGHVDDEIIVVDNGSADDTLAVLATMAEATLGAPLLRWISLPTNEGFAGATNRGARDAKNPVVIMLNNDMVVEPDFVQPLLDAFAAEPNVFGVSCQIDFIDPSKPRWETGKVHGELKRGLVRLFHLDRFDEDLIYPIFFAGGGASAYDRERFLELGGFDDHVFSPVYIEDVDLGYRAWKRGWASVLAPRSKVHHKHRGTTRRLWSEGVIHSFFLKNLSALVWKNVDSWGVLRRHLTGLALLPLKAFREEGGRCAIATVKGLAKQIPVTLQGRLRESRIPRVLSDEQILQISRYRHAYRAHFHPEDRAAGGRPQVLVVAPYSPAPPVHGGAVRMLNLIREMRAACDVTLIAFTDTEAERRTENLSLLRDLCRDVVLLPRDGAGSGGWLEPSKTRGFHSALLAEHVEYWLDRRHFDVVQVEYTHMAHFLPRACPGLLRVLVEHDVTFVAQRRARAIASSLPRRLNLWYDGLKTLRHEVAAVESADLVLTMSDDDRASLARYVDPTPLVTVPNGVSCRDFPLRDDGEEEPATVLFVGFFRHEPNVEAVLWFARDVLPKIRAQRPDALFRVVGAYPPQALAALAAADPLIEVTGMVPETASHYRRATVFVAPIQRGSGTRLKILEAMASGCAVVSTTIGAEGLGAGASEIVIADRADDLASSVCALLGDPARRRALSRAARRFVERTYDWPAIAHAMLRAYGIATDDVVVARGDGDGNGNGTRAAEHGTSAADGATHPLLNGAAHAWDAEGAQ
jgi:glycosyltransferase involved in cell wall biosynthesis/GT2 family glycosyltransferase